MAQLVDKYDQAEDQDNCEYAQQHDN
jgi:hypothetical protein